MRNIFKEKMFKIFIRADDIIFGKECHIIKHDINTHMHIHVNYIFNHN